MCLISCTACSAVAMRKNHLLCSFLHYAMYPGCLQHLDCVSLVIRYQTESLITYLYMWTGAVRTTRGCVVVFTRESEARSQLLDKQNFLLAPEGEADSS